MTTELEKKMEETIDTYFDDTGVRKLHDTTWQEDKENMIKALSQIVTKDYKEQLIKLAKDLAEGMENKNLSPTQFVSKINYLIGYILALEEKE